MFAEVPGMVGHHQRNSQPSYSTKWFLAAGSYGWSLCCFSPISKVGYYYSDNQKEIKQIHKGLKALLYHTALTLQHTGFTNDEQNHQVISLLEEVIFLFEGHAYSKDTLVFPMIKDVAPHLVADFEKQHVRDHQLAKELESVIDQLKAGRSREEKTKTGIQIQLALTEFIAFNLSHMNQEETIINDKLWATYSDAELMSIPPKVVATLPLEKNARYAYWMLKGLSQNEITRWYNGIKENAPALVFA